MSSPGLPETSAFACVHSARCGGCAYMGVPAAEQLAHKRARVGDARAPYPTLRALPVLDTRPAEPMLEYRTRAKLVVSPAGEVGLYARGSHDVVDIPECRVLHPVLRALVARVRRSLAPAAPSS